MPAMAAPPLPSRADGVYAGVEAAKGDRTMRGGHAAWRALDRARALNLGGATRIGGDGITRRRLLAAMGAGATLAALPSCLQPGPRRIAVVGGGLAGLTALHRLRSRGFDAILYEARGRPGGRTRSVHGVFAADYAFDEGGQLVNGDHADMIALARGLGLRLIDRRATGGKDEVQIGSAGRVDERALAEGLRVIAAQITADADRLDADHRTVGAEIDALSVAGYLDRHGLASGDARDAIEAAIRTEYGAEPDQASALELLFNLPTVDGARVTRLSLSDERYLVEGGAGQIAQRLAARHAPAVRLNMRLAAIDLDRDGSVRLAFADGREARFDQAIIALPAPLIREVRIDGPLDARWRALLAEVDLGRNEKIIAGYDQARWRDAIGASGALWAAKGFSEAWDAASSARRAGDPAALCYFLGGDQVDQAGRTSTAAAAGRFDAMARTVLPDLPAPNGRIRRTHWCADPLSKGAYINFRPGQLSRFGGLLTLEGPEGPRPSRSGRLLFAGEWLSDAWPGYMNGAAQTGRIAADAAMAAVRTQRAA
ncbi:MAG TPA: NAD(P)/FAD-dependent oxidoreductase [Allosphingosinicella sp.]|nr:NAD(P)/FAD-dependent oxidoreductase [Allosphingosinicella sp.]